jgi:hypothetical protein
VRLVPTVTAELEAAGPEPVAGADTWLVEPLLPQAAASMAAPAVPRVSRVRRGAFMAFLRACGLSLSPEGTDVGADRFTKYARRL